MYKNKNEQNKTKTENRNEQKRTKQNKKYKGVVEMKKRAAKIAILMCLIGTVSMAGEITVSAAASLKDVMQDIKKVYESESKGEKVTFNFGGSGSLQKQIENGAPADVFVSAAAKQMNELQKENLIENSTRTDIVTNEVVLILPKMSKSKIKDYNGLVNGDIKKIGCGEPASVPVGQYSMEVFKNIGINEKISGKLVYAKDVRTVLSWVESENADAGIVYRTDAVISDKIKIVCAAPKGSHSSIVYPAAVISESKSKESAGKFVKFLKSAKAKELFIKYGFTPVN